MMVSGSQAVGRVPLVWHRATTGAVREGYQEKMEWTTYDLCWENKQEFVADVVVPTLILLKFNLDLFLLV